VHEKKRIFSTLLKKKKEMFVIDVILHRDLLRAKAHLFRADVAEGHSETNQFVLLICEPRG